MITISLQWIDKFNSQNTIANYSTYKFPTSDLLEL